MNSCFIVEFPKYVNIYHSSFSSNCKQLFNCLQLKHFTIQLISRHLISDGFNKQTGLTRIEDSWLILIHKCLNNVINKNV